MGKFGAMKISPFLKIIFEKIMKYMLEIRDVVAPAMLPWTSYVEMKAENGSYYNTPYILVCIHFSPGRFFLVIRDRSINSAPSHRRAPHYIHKWQQYIIHYIMYMVTPNT